MRKACLAIGVTAAVLLLGPASAGATTFDGSCKLRATVHFTPSINVIPQQVSYRVTDGGKADGSIQLFSVADASTPVDPASTPKLPDVKAPVETEPKPAVKEIVAPAPPAVPLGTPDPSLDQTVKANTTADLSGVATCTSTWWVTQGGFGASAATASIVLMA